MFIYTYEMICDLQDVEKQMAIIPWNDTSVLLENNYVSLWFSINKMNKGLMAWFKMYSQPTFISCTKSLGRLGIINNHTSRLPPIFLAMDAWMTSQLNVALICKLSGSLMSLACFWTCYPVMFVQPCTSRCLVNWCRNEMSVLYTWYSISTENKNG